jgi:hypothetical protein
MKEELLMKFDLQSIESIQMIEAIVSIGYRKTGNKFSVIFNGSKGYLDSMEIMCEGKQTENNKLDIATLRFKNHSLKPININIFYSVETGIRLSAGKDEPRCTREEVKPQPEENTNDDGLPF